VNRRLAVTESEIEAAVIKVVAEKLDQMELGC